MGFFSFSGRIGRLQWWLAQLAVLGIIVVGYGILLGLIASGQVEADTADDMAAPSIFGYFVMFSMIVSCWWISLASTVKRFHDRDKSGWWVLVSFVPILGPLWQIIECGFLSGTDGGNHYGPSPGGGGGGSMLAGDFESFEPRRFAPTPAPAAPAAMAVASEAVAPRRAAAPQGFGRRGRAA